MATATKSRKYRFATRQAAEEAQHKASLDAQCNGVCLAELANGNVHWIKRGNYSAGIVRPDSPTGGYMILRYSKRGERPSTTAHWLSDWHWDTIRHYEIIPARDQEQLDLRQLAYDVRCYHNGVLEQLTA
jgi:hypothetical protein